MENEPRALSALEARLLQKEMGACAKQISDGMKLISEAFAKYQLPEKAVEALAGTFKSLPWIKYGGYYGNNSTIANEVGIQSIQIPESVKHAMLNYASKELLAKVDDISELAGNAHDLAQRIAANQ